MASQKMPSTDGLGGVMKQKAVRTGGLVSMVFDKKRLARKPSEKKGSERGPGNVHHIGFSNEMPQMDEPWHADHAKWERTVVVAPCRSLCSQSDIEFRDPLFITDLREPAGEGKDDNPHPADAG